MVLVEQQFRGIANLSQSSLLHLVDAEFGCAAKAVLYASQNAVHVVLVTLKLYYGIDDVFKNLWSGKSSFLGDVSNKYYGYATGLGKAE